MESLFCFKMKPSLRFTAARWLLPVLVLFLVSAQAEAKTAKLRDIADTVASNPIMTKFAAMLQASELGTFLSSRGPFTVFVPTDSAFSKLPPGTLETLLLPQNKVRLQDILLYHVVNGKRLTAKDLLTLKSVLSCMGDPPAPLAVRTNHIGVQFVMKAKIVHADIKCQNGIINEVDTVLMPPEGSLPALAPPPVPAPATNAPPSVVVVPWTGTNAAPDDTNAAPVIPVAPIAAPEAAPH